jgi:hypothetical protein
MNYLIISAAFHSKWFEVENSQEQISMPVKIFFCYAHEDETLLNQLKTHLKPLQWKGLIDTWYDRDISPGTEWKQEINKRLNEAEIILLLVSPDFMASDYCYSVEMKQALERHERGESRVIPIILRPTLWQGELGTLQALPIDAKPIKSWPDPDDAFFNVAEGIQKIIGQITAQTNQQTIEFSIQPGTVETFDADVIALKYAQAFYGADEFVASLLSEVGILTEDLCPPVGEYRFLETRDAINAHHVLFVGVPDLYEFGYYVIRQLSSQTLRILMKQAPTTKHLATTIHGVGFGLDEIESINAQFAGYLDAIQSGEMPSALKFITIIERDSSRLNRLRQALDESLASANYATRAEKRWAYRLIAQKPTTVSQESLNITGAIERAGIESSNIPVVLVAMPRAEDMDDVFYFGIYQPVHAANLLCENIGQKTFTEDALEQMKKKIESAAVVIAELSGANPNVYLEVGYAWGKGRPTILLIKEGQELHFETGGQICLKYKNIKSLAESLQTILKELNAKGFV